MRRLELDLLKDDAGARWLGLALLGAGVAAALGVAAEYTALGDRMARAESGLREATRSARKLSFAAPQKGEAQKIALEFQQARDVVVRLQQPWQELFRSLESARRPNVALLSIESEQEKRLVKITGEAKDLEAMVTYLAALRQRPALADVYLESHELQLKDPQRPVRFVLTASWGARK
jgi:Tfp pilus assembly protein PilN